MSNTFSFSLTATASVSCNGEACGDDCPVCTKESE